MWDILVRQVYPRCWTIDRPTWSITLAYIGQRGRSGLYKITKYDVKYTVWLSARLVEGLSPQRMYKGGGFESLLGQSFFFPSCRLTYWSIFLLCTRFTHFLFYYFILLYFTFDFKIKINSIQRGLYRLMLAATIVSMYKPDPHPLTYTGYS